MSHSPDPSNNPTTSATDSRPGWPPIGHLVAVALGGAIGSSLRVAWSLAISQQAGQFPWSTFSENVVGAFLLGFMMIVWIERWPAHRSFQLFLCTGLLGSFTTFSNLSLEWVSLVGGGSWLAFVYPITSILAGFLAAFTGMYLARCLSVQEDTP